MRDARGRFTRGNMAAAAGGLARAAKLSARRRREIAAAGRAAQVEKWFLGDDQGQRRYMAQLGAWVYDQQAGAGAPGSALQAVATHPGTISEFCARRWQPALLTGPHLDVDFYAFGGSGITPVSTVTL